LLRLLVEMRDYLDTMHRENISRITELEEANLLLMETLAVISSKLLDANGHATDPTWFETPGFDVVLEQLQYHHSSRFKETKLHGPGFIKCKLCHVTTWLADNPGSKTAHLDNCPVAAWDKPGTRSASDGPI
jgi:hypothetical protein